MGGVGWMAGRLDGSSPLSPPGATELVSALSAADAFGSPLKLSLNCCNQPQKLPRPSCLSLPYLICSASGQTIWHKLQGNAIKRNCTSPRCSGSGTLRGVHMRDSGPVYLRVRVRPRASMITSAFSVW